MTTTTKQVVEINDEGDFILPERLVERIRRAAAMRFADVCERALNATPCLTTDDWQDFIALRHDVESAAKVFDVIDYGYTETHDLVVNADTVAGLAGDACDTARYELSQMVEQGEGAATVAELAALAADLETLAEQLTDWTEAR